jgi:hypothetical protein
MTRDYPGSTFTSYYQPASDPDINFEAARDKLDLIATGRRIAHFIRDPNWEVIIGTLENYRDNATADLISLPPGHPDVLASHAAASAISDLVRKFKSDLETAVNAQPDEEVAAYVQWLKTNNDPMELMDQQSN